MAGAGGVRMPPTLSMAHDDAWVGTVALATRRGDARRERKYRRKQRNHNDGMLRGSRRTVKHLGDLRVGAVVSVFVAPC